MKSNIDFSRLENAASLAKDIRLWIGERSHPENYTDVKDPELIRDTFDRFTDNLKGTNETPL